MQSTILENFHGDNLNKVKALIKRKRYNGYMCFPLFAVYEHPKDFADKYVVRLWQINREIGKPVPTEWCVVKDTLEEVRNSIPSGFIRYDRNSSDDPVIIETWF